MTDERRGAAPLAVSGRHLGAIVRGARTAQHMTLAELGRRTGYSAAQVSRYERGIAPLTDLEVLLRFAGALGLVPEDLGVAIPGAAGDRIASAPRSARTGRNRGPGDDHHGSQQHSGSRPTAPRGTVEAVRTYADRGMVTRQEWNAIISGAARELWLYGMAEYGYATDDDVPGILKDVTAKGCRVRVLLLNPASPATTSIDRDEGNPAGTLVARTRAALARFGQMRRDCGDRMQIRVYDGYPTVSVVRGDDRMLVTPYLRFFIGSNSPTFEIRSARASKMFARYVRHFESTWHLAKDWIS